MSDTATEYQALLARARGHRRQLQFDLQELRDLLAVSHALRPLLGRSLPLLPYAAATAGVALLVIQLRRGRTPPALIAAGAALDALRVWMLLRRR